jgi:hypothetical protein
VKCAFILCLFAASAVAQEFEYGIGQTEQVTKGLVSYWSMRSSGSTIYDETGLNNAAPVGSPAISYANGAVSDGAYFDSTSYITAPATGLPLGNSNRTISAWIMTTNSMANNNYGTIVRYGVYNTSSTFEMGFASPGGATNVLYASQYGDNINSRPTKINDGKWHHCCVVFESPNAYVLYVDAVVTATKSMTTATLATTNVVIGATANVKYVGHIDEVRIYNVAKTADEIKQLYRMGALPRGLK